MDFKGKLAHLLNSDSSGDKERPKLDILTLAKSQQSNLVHLAMEMSATQLGKILKKKEVEWASLGIIWLVKEDPEGMETL